MSLIPSNEEIIARTYFLQSINTPLGVWCARIILIVLVIVLFAMYRYASKKNKEAKNNKEE